MAVLAVQLANADRMMTHAEAVREGIAVSFADGHSGVVPWSALPEVQALSNLRELNLPNPYLLALHPKSGAPVEIPWDFARHYCDPMYRQGVKEVAQKGRAALGKRIRELRERQELSQAELASRASIGRITLVRIEGGQRSPRYETLISLASALAVEPESLLTG